MSLSLALKSNLGAAAALVLSKTPKTGLRSVVFDTWWNSYTTNIIVTPKIGLRSYNMQNTHNYGTSKKHI